MKNNIKALVNQVKKAINTRSAIPMLGYAYADNNGDLIARNMDNHTDIFVFIAGIVEDISARNKVYDKNALTLSADTGSFKGGQTTEDKSIDLFDLPDGDFVKAFEISADDLKKAAISCSKDNTRPVLTAIHITPAGMIESCDGFRAYRKNKLTVNWDSLSDTEKENGVLLSAAVAAYGFKGSISVFNSDRYLKLEDSSGLTLYVRKYDKELKYFNLNNIYKDNIKLSGSAKIKNVKEFLPVLKTAAAADRRSYISLRLRDGRIEYHIEALDIFGSIEADTEIFDSEFYITLNPRYILDALNQDCNYIEFDVTRHAPIYVSGNDGEKALLLPIRDDGVNPFYRYDRIEAGKKRAAIEAINARQNTANRFENIGEAEIKKELEAMETPAESATVESPENTPADDLEAPEATTAATVETPAAPEMAAPENTEPETVKTSEKLEILTPEMVQARFFYKQMIDCNFVPSKYETLQAMAIYQENREILKPIASKTGALYLDTLSIIAAIMATAEKLA